MITKGTNEYKKAQKNATIIYNMATCGRSRGQLDWGDAEVYLTEMCEHIISNVNGFAAEVAKTVKNTIRMWGFGYTVARCSEKQSWILACACVESGYEFEF